MSPYRGPLSTLLAASAALILLVGIFGCGSEDPSTPEVGFGTIEIKVPTETVGATWHLYGPGESFRHGDTDVVLSELPSGQYTIIWTAVKDWTGPMPAKRTLAANTTLVLNGVYQDKAPGSNFVRIEGADFIMGSDSGSRKYPQDRPDSLVAWYDTVCAEDFEAVCDTLWEYYTAVDTLSYPAEISRDADELRHRVEITYTHFIGKTEITNQEFVELGNWALVNGAATATDSSMHDTLDGSTVELINFDFVDTPIDIQDGVLRLKKAEFAARPVIELTWYGAASYCDWLSLREGVDKAYDHITWALISPNYRLPTEAEWENACRAGTQSAYWSGDIVSGGCSEPALQNAGWFCGNAGGASHDVGTKAANHLGLFDIHGNVWEWCHDYYGLYEVPPIPLDPDLPPPSRPLLFYEDEDLVPVVDPFGPVEGELRVVRSGRWLLAGSLCRSAGRMMAVPEFRGQNIGFRVASGEELSP